MVTKRSYVRCGCGYCTTMILVSEDPEGEIDWI